MKEQEAKGKLSSLGLKTPLSKMPLFGDINFNFINDLIVVISIK